MRCLLTIIMMMFLVTPAFAGSSYCRMDGPHNCMEQSEDQLIAMTKNTINHINVTQDQHPFKTQNDVVLEAAAKEQAQIKQANQPAWYAFWRK